MTPTLSPEAGSRRPGTRVTFLVFSRSTIIGVLVIIDTGIYVLNCGRGDE
jgi:hypothetical protein